MDVSPLLYLGCILFIIGNNFRFLNKINLELFEIVLFLHKVEILLSFCESKNKKSFSKFQLRKPFVNNMYPNCIWRLKLCRNFKFQ